MLWQNGQLSSAALQSEQPKRDHEVFPGMRGLANSWSNCVGMMMKQLVGCYRVMAERLGVPLVEQGLKQQQELKRRGCCVDWTGR